MNKKKLYIDRIRSNLGSKNFLNDNDIEKLYNTTCKTLVNRLIQAENSLIDLDYANLVLAAHSLKSTAKLLDLKKCASIALTVEIAARKKQEIDFKELISKLRNELEYFLENDHQDV